MDCTELSDVDLIEEMETRGYTAHYQADLVDIDTYNDIEKLYLDYMLTGPDFFDAQLKLFFNKYLNKYIK